MDDDDHSPFASFFHVWLVGISSVDLGLSQFIAGVISVFNPEVELSVYAQYGIFVAILIIHGILNSVAVSWNGIMNQGACKLVVFFFVVMDEGCLRRTNFLFFFFFFFFCVPSLCQYVGYFIDRHCGSSINQTASQWRFRGTLDAKEKRPLSLSHDGLIVLPPSPFSLRNFIMALVSAVMVLRFCS
ncbi:hypothetical protein BDF20DRAFT_306059 [Mycotypha africana]|uniref:uncharacterized protein n=1 Tax=Mycotypha africana TaxID=64632 RepID=UPI002301A57F|nr:uncharacterized protein BDF20DRAFT_306059 [Mycotypha africana]KAI8988110.1 hypothetical protein BDF20DRAFT_306059 [Mycotypha africana]